MATKLFLRSTADNAIGNYYDMVTTAGSSAVEAIVNTAASGTQIQWTRTAGGTVLEFISGRVPSGGFTLSGTMSFSIWASENNMSANAGARARVFKRAANGTETEIGGGPYDDGVEFSTPNVAEMTWTGTPTSTSFAENDRLIVRYYITNIGTMAAGYTCRLTYDAADAATGDSFFQINENVTFKAEPTTHQGLVDISGTGSIVSASTAFKPGASALTGTGSLAADSTLIYAADGYRILEDGDSRISESDDVRVTENFAGTSSQVGEATLAASSSLVSSADKTLTALTTLSGTGSVSATGDRTVYGLSALTGTGTLASVGVKKLNASVAIEGVGSLTAASDGTISGAVSLTGVGSLSSVGLRSVAGLSALSGISTLSGTGLRKVAGIFSVSGAGTLAGIGTKKLNGLTTLSGSGTISALSSKTLQGASALSATGSKLSVGVKTLNGTISLTGVGSLTAVGIAGAENFAELNATSTLSATPEVVKYVTVSLVGSSDLVATVFSSLVWVNQTGGTRYTSYDIERGTELGDTRVTETDEWQLATPWVKAGYTNRLLENGDMRITEDDRIRKTNLESEWIIPDMIYKKETGIWKRGY